MGVFGSGLTGGCTISRTGGQKNGFLWVCGGLAKGMKVRRPVVRHPPWATVAEMRMEALVIAALFVTTLAMYAYLFVQGTDFGWGATVAVPTAVPAGNGTTQRQVPALTLPHPSARPDFYLPGIVPRSYDDLEISFLARLNTQRSGAGLQPL